MKILKTRKFIIFACHDADDINTFKKMDSKLYASTKASSVIMDEATTAFFFVGKKQHEANGYITISKGSETDTANVQVHANPVVAAKYLEQILTKAIEWNHNNA